MTVAEGSRTALWLRSILNPMATGGAHQGSVPVGNTDIAIVFAPYPGGLGDARGVGARRIWSERDWLIYVSGPATSESTIYGIADTIDARLDHTRRENAGPDCIILSCLRQDEYGPLYEPIPGSADKWLNVGGYWRIRNEYTG